MKNLELENYYQYLNKSDYKKCTKEVKNYSMISFFKYFKHLQNIDEEDKLGLYFNPNLILDVKRN